MKLYMVRHNNKDSMAVSDDGRNFKILTLSKFMPNSFSCIEEFLEGSSLEELRNFIRKEDLDDIVVNEENILPPISKPKQNIMCMGLNYEDHIKESERVFLKDIKRPKYPIIFTKSILSINAPYGNIELRDEVSCELDWESELAVVIGNPGIRIKKEDAYNFSDCMFKLTSEGHVLMNYINLPMSNAFLQKIGFSFCVTRGVYSGGNPTARKKSFSLAKSFIKKTLPE